MLIINPGAGNVTEDLGLEQAYKNILQFIEDSEVPLEVSDYNSKPEENGRYNFILKLSLPVDISINVEMPSLPIEKVRFMGEQGQSIFDFPRLYVDGSSWVWKYAIVTKEQIIERLQSDIADYKRDIEICEKAINQLKN